MKYNSLLNKISLNVALRRFFGNYEKRNVHATLEDRGLLTAVFPDKRRELENLFAGHTQAVYCGFDPTARSLHIGNLLGIIALIHHQRAGHTPIALIGSATALIGDPSGRSTSRRQLDISEVAENSQCIEDSIKRIFANHDQYLWPSIAQNKTKVKAPKLPELKVLNNSKWYQYVNLIDFMSKFGYHLRMSDLLSRKQVQTRLENTDGLSFTEFSYQILQAYDWLYLLDNYRCNLQIGGNDQTGNITTGYELITKLKPDSKCFGLTLPLLTDKAGEKLGKSVGNALWLDESELSTFEFYQYFLNTSDQMIERYLKLFTFIPISEITDLMQNHKQKPHHFLAQKRLAEHITLLVRGQNGLDSAIKCTKAFFANDIESLTHLNEDEFTSIFKSAKNYSLVLKPDMKILELLLEAGIYDNVDIALKIINEGGVSVNYTRIKKPDVVIKKDEHVLRSNITLVKTGKKSFHVIRWLNLTEL